MDLSHIRLNVAIFLKWAGENPLLAVIFVAVGFTLFGLLLWFVVVGAKNLDSLQRKKRRRADAEKKRRAYK